MAPSCTLARPSGNVPVKASWALEKETLLLGPEGSPPLALPVGSLNGISGDGYRIELSHSEGALTLERLGADGPTLLEALRRIWPPLRAKLLRLSGSGDAIAFSCQLLAKDCSWPCQALLYGELLLYAPEGRDLQPIFLPRVSEVALDDAAFAVRLKGWDSSTTGFGKLGARRDEFFEHISKARLDLTRAGRELLGGQLPRLGPGSIASLAGAWPPGRLASLGELDGACPGFCQAFGEWLARTPRREEGQALMGAASDSYVGYAPAQTAGDSAPDERDTTPEGAQPAPDGSPSAGPPDQPLLWLLARLGSRWFLEALSEGDHATYRFEGGAEMPGLVGLLLCAPEFSKEALYLPLEALAGERAPLAVPARELGFLSALRQRFRGRIIHGDRGRWLKEVGVVA